jgi:hypothetical protein
MKKSILYIIIGFSIFVSFRNPESIKNEFSKTPLSDYRDAYVGTYFCHSKSPQIRFDKPPVIIRDTISIIVTKDAIDSVLKFSIGINILKFKLKTGLLSSFPDEDRHKNGKFYSSDSLRLYISTGRANYISLIGKKN